jgi:hypothetical protein
MKAMDCRFPNGGDMCTVYRLGGGVLKINDIHLKELGW